MGGVCTRIGAGDVDLLEVISSIELKDLGVVLLAVEALFNERFARTVHR
mgnify:CR=1 FL=1